MLALSSTALKIFGPISSYLHAEVGYLRLIKVISLVDHLSLV